ncbi:hypothetical protein CEXT_446511 [Caerostris extrusa]|uniref:Uncharacterized protein n=1 Tax=Caerostris extrusa TaxID=172846 RepID=A0AAV4V104_CAEEX|nr:hypothetical protein CEXT_446511 [Caerostris extrusa]
MFIHRPHHLYHRFSNCDNLQDENNCRASTIAQSGRGLPANFHVCESRVWKLSIQVRVSSAQGQGVLVIGKKSLIKNTPDRARGAPPFVERNYSILPILTKRSKKHPQVSLSG